MKRFYKNVSVGERDNMFMVLLDEKPIKTPEKSLMLTPTRKMAEAAAKEWQAQTEEVDPFSMPITKLINTAIDRVAMRRQDIIDELVQFAASDQLCYRADQPDELIRLQDETWSPLLKNMKAVHDIELKLTNGIVFIEQDINMINKIRALIDKIENFKLAAFYGLTTGTGSVTIGFNLFEGHIDVEQAWNAGQLDESFQISKWGLDGEAEIRRANLKTELINAYGFLALC